MHLQTLPVQPSRARDGIAADLAGGTSVDLTDYVAVIRRRKWLIIGITLLVGALAVLSTWRDTPLYSSSTVVLINPISPSAISTMERSSARPDQLINSATERLLAESEAVYDRAVTIMRANGSDPDALGGVTATPTQDVQVLTLEHTGTTPEIARDGAQAYAEAYLQYRGERASEAATERVSAVERQVKELQTLLTAADKQAAAASPNTAEFSSAQSRRTVLTNQIVTLQSTIAGLSTAAMAPGEVLSGAELPSAPFAPQRGRTAGAGLLVGAIIGLAVAFTRDRFDDRLRYERDVLQAGGLPVVASLPRGPMFLRRRTAGLVTVHAPDGPAAESYRRLRSWLSSFPEERAPRALLVTSARPGEGKTTISCNLAVSLAEAGNKVLLISADLRNAQAHEVLGMENTDGLAEVLTGVVKIDDVVRSVPPVPGLFFVSSGRTPRRPADLLAGPRMRELVFAALSSYDYVVLDTPPVLSVADCLAVSTYVDGVFMAVKGRVTPAAMLDHARSQLTAVGAPLLGAIVWNIESTTQDPYLYAGPQAGPPKWWHMVREQTGRNRAGDNAREDAGKR